MIKNYINRIIQLKNNSGLFGALTYIRRYLFIKFMNFTFNKPIKVRIHDYLMYLDLSDPGISRHLFMIRTREEQLRFILQNEIKKGDAILDLGANIGYYALMEWSLIGDAGKVYALEPSPHNFDILQKNISLNRAENIIEVFNLAGGSKISKEKFYLSEHSNLNTFLPNLYRYNDYQKDVTDKFIMMDVIDMTNFISDKRKIDLLRMDIEGFEVDVFKGLKKAIKEEVFNGKIVFECHFPKYDDKMNNIREQLNMLFENGYYPKIMTSNDENNSHFTDKGYKPEKVFEGVDRSQGIYYNISPNDAEYFICDVGGVRDVLLEK